MNADHVRRNVLAGTVSNYANVFLRMGLGVVTFRMLYQGLGKEEFGFWSLLWSVFGYGVLLDFGFGYAAQKRVAELSVKKEWETLGGVLSTIFYFYFASAAVLVLGAFLFSGPLIGFFGVSPENREVFRGSLILFVVGMGLAFPLGIFPEVLRGQQRLWMANLVSMGGMVANFVGVCVVLGYKLGFNVLIAWSLACVLIPDAVAMVMALRHMPGVRISWRLFSMAQVRETSRFSVYAYLNMLGNILRNKTDQVVVGSVLSVGAVAPYQAGGKVGEMFHLLTRQLSEALSPAAAHLHASGDREALRRMLVGGMRWSVMAATPLYFVSAMYLPGLVRILTGDAQPAESTLWVGQLLLFWYWSLVVTHLVFKRMFMMAGQERRMMWQGVTEALANLALSLFLTWYLKSIVGVAIGSVIPTVLFGWGLLWGWAAVEAGCTRLELFRKVVWGSLMGCVPMLIVGLILRYQPYWKSGSTTLLVLVEGGFVMAVGLCGVWGITLDRAERAEVWGRLNRRLARKRT